MKKFEVIKGGAERKMSGAEKTLRLFIDREIVNTREEPVEEVLVIGRTKSGQLVYMSDYPTIFEAFFMTERFKNYIVRKKS